MGKFDHKHKPECFVASRTVCGKIEFFPPFDIDLDYEIEILTADIELYEHLWQEFITEEKTLPVEGCTRRFEGLERISGLKTKARQRLSELNFIKLTQKEQK